MPTPPRRQPRVSQTTIWAAIGAAIVVHGTLLGSVQAFGVSLVGEGFLVKAAPAPAESEVALQTTCTGDVLLAASARYAMCLAPWSNDVEGCGNDAVMAMWMDLSSCQNTGESIAAAPVSFVPERATEKLTPIDPEPLLEELRQQEEKEKLALQQPPPPQPQNQPPPPPPPPPQRPAQVVEVVKPNTDKEPENARFLSEHNVEVEKQKVARGAVKEPMVAKSKPEELTPKNDPKEASVKELAEKPPGKDARAPDDPGPLAMRTKGAPAPSEVPQDSRTKGSTTGERGPIGADGFVPRRGDGSIEQQKRDPGELTRGQGGAGGGTPQVPNLKPTQESLERIAGGYLGRRTNPVLILAPNGCN